MKPGSQVICIDNSGFEEFVEKDVPYTVREITEIGQVVNSNNPIKKFRCAEIGIRLEEVVANPEIYSFKWFDMPFPIVNFRELQLPGELAEILTQELQLV